MRQSDPTKESGILFAQAFLAVEDMSDVEYGHDGVMALAHAYVDLEAERDALREALENVVDEGVTHWHEDSEATNYIYEYLGLSQAQYAAWVEHDWGKFASAPSLQEERAALERTQ